VGVAAPHRHLASHQIRARHVDERCQFRAEQRDVDALPFPGALAMIQRCQNAGEGILRRNHIDQRNAGLDRRPVRLARDAHQPTHRLNRHVVACTVAVGADLPKAGDATIDNIWPLSAQGFVP